jgi:hypothetical protein
MGQQISGAQLPMGITQQQLALAQQQYGGAQQQPGNQGWANYAEAQPGYPAARSQGEPVEYPYYSAFANNGAAMQPNGQIAPQAQPSPMESGAPLIQAPATNQMTIAPPGPQPVHQRLDITQSMGRTIPASNVISGSELGIRSTLTPTTNS